MQAAFKDLDYDVPIVREPQQGRRNIVLGAHLLKALPADIDCVVWQLEQVGEGPVWATGAYQALLKSAEVTPGCAVWDYSPLNLTKLAGMGIEAQLLPVGYHECMRWPISALLVSEDAPTQEIDILHYGSMNQRRANIMQGLDAAGIRAYHVFGVYGEERDALIARARLVLNVSYYESKIFNVTRCSTLFANSVPVVSEIGPGSEAFHGTGGFAEYDGLVEKCVEVLANHDQVGNRGFEIFSQMKQVDYLKAVL